MIIQSRRPAKPADSAPLVLTPEAEPPPRPTVRFDLGFLRLREYVRKPYADRDNEIGSRRDCARNTNTRLKRETFEHRPATETVEPCPMASAAPRLELCARRRRAQRRRPEHGCQTPSRHSKTFARTSVAFNLTPGLQQWARLARAVLCTDRDDRDHLLQAEVRLFICRAPSWHPNWKPPLAPTDRSQSLHVPRIGKTSRHCAPGSCHHLLIRN